MQIKQSERGGIGEREEKVRALRNFGEERDCWQSMSFIFQYSYPDRILCAG